MYKVLTLGRKSADPNERSLTYFYIIKNKIYINFTRQGTLISNIPSQWFLGFYLGSSYFQKIAFYYHYF